MSTHSTPISRRAALLSLAAGVLAIASPAGAPVTVCLFNERDERLVFDAPSVEAGEKLAENLLREHLAGRVKLAWRGGRDQAFRNLTARVERDGRMVEADVYCTLALATRDRIAFGGWPVEAPAAPTSAPRATPRPMYDASSEKPDAELVRGIVLGKMAGGRGVRLARPASPEFRRGFRVGRSLASTTPSAPVARRRCSMNVAGGVA
jgi:hypothetical protein